MRKWLLALIILVPIIEIWGVLQVADLIGGWNTFMLLMLISIIGVVTMMLEIKRVLFEAKHQLAHGQIPGRSFINGVCVCLGGFLLIIPGFFSDIFGLILLLPFTRPLLEAYILKWIEKSMRNGRFTLRRF